MTDWQVFTNLPKCPKCGKSRLLLIHDPCPTKKDPASKSFILIDIHSGRFKCPDCGDIWSIETNKIYCPCGAIFEGGQVWQAGSLEIGQKSNSNWIREVGVSKGNLETRFLGWEKKPAQKKKKKSGNCYISTAICTSLGKDDDCYELNLLRKFRDDVLLKSSIGSKLVESYYDCAPTLVNQINSLDNYIEIYYDVKYK